jgi:predicted amidohydrolase YtcJ
MTSMVRWLFPVALITSISVGAQTPVPAPDLILTNGKFVTLEGGVVAEAAAIRDGRFVTVGPGADVRRLAGDSTRIIDLHGRTVIPGLQDSHVHVSGIGAARLAEAHIGDARTIPEILDIIRKVAARKAAGEWIEVSGDLRYIRIAENRYPTRAELDLAAPRHPVLVPTGHLSTANSLALKLAGITRDTPDPDGGHIEHDATGEPTGVLLERAAALVSRLMPRRKLDYGAAIVAAQQHLNRLGFTSARETGLSPDVLAAYRALAAQHRLTVRSSVLLRPDARDEQDALSQIRSWGAEADKGDDMLRVWGIKLAIDGGLALTTSALMHEPYNDRPGDRGLQTTPTETFYRMVLTAAQAGLRVAVHASGDAGLQRVLETYEKVSADVDIRGKRYSVEHASLPTARALELMRALGVVASVQPGQFTTAPVSLFAALGPERTGRIAPLRTYARTGIVIAGGSDAPAFQLNPFHGIWGAVVRRSRTSGRVVAQDERLTREEALRMYTQAGAYLTGEERQKGTIAPGKLADLVVLSDDILTCDVEKIPEITPVATILGGRVVYGELQGT